MRILICGINYFPEPTGVGKYTGEMAEWLYSKAVSVRVISAPPYYPEWRIGSGYSSKKYKFENINGIYVWRCPIWIPRQKTGFKRILHLLTFTASSVPILFKQIFWKPDVIIVIEPAFFCAPLSLIVAKLSGAQSWLHIQDIEIDAAFKMGYLSNRKLYSMAKHIERIIMKQFDRISTISKKMLEMIVNSEIPSEKCVLFPNWVDTKKMFPLFESTLLRKEWGVKDNTVVVLYAGNMGEKQGLEIIIKTAKKLEAEPNILFVLCGNGTARGRLIKMADGMRNIRFLPIQPTERYNLLLNTADIHLLPQRAGAEGLVMPSKLTGILACGGFVIALARKNSELSNVVLKAGGIVCMPGDISELSNLIKRFSKDNLLNSDRKNKARNYAESFFSKESILNDFYKELNNITLKQNINYWA